MNEALRQLNRRTARAGLPLNGTLELTPLCNLRCKMCYIHRPEALPQKPTLRPLSFWLELAEALRQAGTLVLVVTGGETFLYPQAEPLLERLRALGFVISLNTNGTLLDRRLDWLGELRPAKINLSLYGASNETYARLCGCEDGFDRLRAAVDGLLDRGLNVCLNGTLTRENRGDIPAMAAFASARGLVLHSTAYLFPPGRYGLHACPSRLSPAEAAEATLELERLQHGEEGLFRRCAEQASRLEAARSGGIAPAGGFTGSAECGRSNCLGGRNSFAVSWEGELMPCVSNGGVRIPLGEGDFPAAWARLRAAVDSLPLPAACGGCPWAAVCNACPATLYNETGAFERLADYPCAYVRAQAEARLDYLRRRGEGIAPDHA